MSVYFVTIDGWEYAVTTSDNPPRPQAVEASLTASAPPACGLP